MKDLFSLDGKIALVTGGSTGIGEMIAEGFLHFGAKVYIVARREEILKKTQEKLSKLGLCEYIVADLGSVNGVETLAKKFCELIEFNQISGTLKGDNKIKKQKNNLNLNVFIKYDSLYKTK